LQRRYKCGGRQQQESWQEQLSLEETSSERITCVCAWWRLEEKDDASVIEGPYLS
jgi:hypothetical protein